jgi:uncharacterized protein YdhG (YjbR/CyaY superfamily)
MKKTKPSKRGPARKPKTGAQRVDESLAGISEPARTALKRVRAIIRSAAPPDASEGIRCGIPMFQYKGTLASLAAFSGHCRVFPGARPAVKFPNEPKNFETAKGTLRFVPEMKPRSAENEGKRGR